MTTKFEQLIEYVINDEEAKAKALFHEIVVEKSRSIYEEIMAKEEAESEEAAEETKHGDDEDLEEETKHDGEDLEEGSLGGDQSDDLIDDVEVEETGLSMEGADEEESGADEDLEDRVVDLEDKLDELMSEFEAMMGDEGSNDAEVDMDMDMDTPDMDAEEVVDDELETEGVMENVALKAAPAPVKSEEGSINKKSTVAANSGAKGAVAKPVHTTGETAQGRSAPGHKDLIGKVQNTPAQSSVKLDAATKPHLAQATGVNVTSPLPKR